MPVNNIILETQVIYKLQRTACLLIPKKRLTLKKEKIRVRGTVLFLQDSSPFGNFSLAFATKDGHNGYNVDKLQGNWPRTLRLNENSSSMPASVWLCSMHLHRSRRIKNDSVTDWKKNPPPPRGGNCIREYKKVNFAKETIKNITSLFFINHRLEPIRTNIKNMKLDQISIPLMLTWWRSNFEIGGSLLVSHLEKFCSI